MCRRSLYVRDGSTSLREKERERGREGKREITSTSGAEQGESGGGCGRGYGPINTALLHWKAFLAPRYTAYERESGHLSGGFI